MPAARVPRTRPTLPAALAGVLLLTACGTQTAESRSGGVPPAGGADATGLPGDVSCGPEPSDTPATPSASAPSGEASDQERDGVRIVGLGGADHDCAVFEVTNPAAEPFTYTITFDLLSATGEGLGSREQTVESVGPGQTIRRAVSLSQPAAPTDGPFSLRIHRVRSVPTSEAPSTGGNCPPSGVHMYADEGSAAMGLRALSVHLVNCGTDTVRLNGYPPVEVLDERHRLIEDVEVLDGGSAIASGTGADGEPRPLALESGEGAYAVLTWRNTTEAGDPVHAPYVRVRAEPGAAPVMVTPELDLGTTGRLGVGPWKQTETGR
jgi:hypothetical protein